MRSLKEKVSLPENQRNRVVSSLVGYNAQNLTGIRLWLGDMDANDDNRLWTFACQEHIDSGTRKSCKRGTLHKKATIHQLKGTYRFQWRSTRMLS